MSEPPFDVKRAHRWFAVELNNLAWDLLEAPALTPEQVDRMIHAAHGACFHWLEVGTPIHHLRAQCLLATAYARAGITKAAVRHAERCLAFSRAITDDQTDFDRASAHGCAAAAYQLDCHSGDAAEQYELACAAAARLTDPADRSLFEKLYPNPAR